MEQDITLLNKATLYLYPICTKDFLVKKITNVLRSRRTLQVTADIKTWGEGMGVNG